VIILIQKKLKLFISQKPKQLLKSALMGFFNPFLYYLILFKAYDLLPAQEAQPLNYTWAIVLAILSIPVLKQKVHPLSFVALLISFIGVFIISVKGNIFSLNLLNFGNVSRETSAEASSFGLSDPLGVGLALSSSIIWAVYWLMNIKDKRDTIIKLFTSFLFGTIYITLTTLITGNLALFNPIGIVTTVYIGVFEMGVTFVLWLKALDYSENSGLMGNFIYLSPFLSLVFIHFILGEAIHPSSIIGLLLIVGGVLLQQYLIGRMNKKRNIKNEN